MSKQIQKELREHYRKQGLLVADSYEFPICDHPIEKWCSNCDYDYETFDRIPHFRKYSFIKAYTEEEFLRELNEK